MFADANSGMTPAPTSAGVLLAAVAGGLIAALGHAVVADDAGDAQASVVYGAMIYQIAKETGAMAAVLCGEVDAVLLTGGMAHSEGLVSRLRSYIGWIATVFVYPGEDELRALAEGAFRVLNGEEEVKIFRVATDAQMPHRDPLVIQGPE